MSSILQNIYSIEALSTAESLEIVYNLKSNGRSITHRLIWIISKYMAILILTQVNDA